MQRSGIFAILMAKKSGMAVQIKYVYTDLSVSQNKIYNNLDTALSGLL